MRKFWRRIFKCLLFLTGLSILWVAVYRFVPVPFTLSMLQYRLSNNENSLKHQWVPLKDQSRNAQLAVICAEDQKFLSHHGFDFTAIKQAYIHNMKGGSMRGGSTISQQTAKNVFLWQGRTWLRKGLEAWFTFLIENLWSKERILEVYLNSIEMGNGVYGIEAASQHWFKKSASDLSRYEAAAIAAILPNPAVFKADPRTAYVESRKRWILQQMENFGPFSLSKQPKMGKNR